MKARVVDRQFSGSSVLLRLESEGGSALWADLRSDTHYPALGSVVRAGWSSDAVHVFGDPS
jgi:hypothetical protein